MTVPDIKSQVGKKSSRRQYAVTEAKLRELCAAVGAKYRGEAPPTFMTILRHGEFELWDRLGVELSSVLHADQEYEYEGPILPDDRLEYETVMSKAFEKQGSAGAMRFMIFDTDVYAVRSGAAVRVGTGRTTVIVR